MCGHLDHVPSIEEQTLDRDPRRIPRQMTVNEVKVQHFDCHAKLGLVEDRIVECAGPAFGSRPTSYRAEAYGMLSFTQFMYRLLTFCQHDGFLGGTLVCDNISLVNIVTGILHAPGVSEELFLDDDVNPDTVFAIALFNNCTLISDWDALAMIQDTLTTVKYPLQIKHVKGHQDDNKPYDSLSLHAQLNVDADALANDYQRIRGKPRPKVLRLPKSRAQLHIRGETITYRYKFSIRTAAFAPALRRYIRIRNDWSHKTMNQIDWESHSASIARERIPRSHAIKLIHDFLPTNYRVSKYSNLRQAKCPCCDYPVETLTHILRCPTRDDARTKLCNSVKATMSRIHTRPILADILLDGLTYWFMGGEKLDTDEYPPAYTQLITQQNTIGWEQLFSGRLSKEWARLQQDFLEDFGFVGKKHTGHLWAVSVTTQIWHEWYNIWEARNQVVHGHDASSQNIKKENKPFVTQLLPTDRDYLFPTLTEHLTKSTTQIANWLNTYRSLFKSSIRRAAWSAADGTLSIRDYFICLEGQYVVL